MYKNDNLVGLGGAAFDIAICIANRPQLDDYPRLDTLQALQNGEIAHIASHTSNHWRKVFNVFAKFIFELRGSELECDTWQEYRDVALLQSDSREALLFSPPEIRRSGIIDAQISKKLSKPENTNVSATHIKIEPTKKSHNVRPQYVKIVAGKTYAQSLNFPFSLTWKDEYFAFNTEQRIIVSPYLDYRQLSNARISQLVRYVKNFQNNNFNKTVTDSDQIA